MSSAIMSHHYISTTHWIPWTVMFSSSYQAFQSTFFCCSSICIYTPLTSMFSSPSRRVHVNSSSSYRAQLSLEAATNNHICKVILQPTSHDNIDGSTLVLLISATFSMNQQHVVFMYVLEYLMYCYNR